MSRARGRTFQMEGTTSAQAQGRKVLAAKTVSLWLEKDKFPFIKFMLL